MIRGKFTARSSGRPVNVMREILRWLKCFGEIVEIGLERGTMTVVELCIGGELLNIQRF